MFRWVESMEHRKRDSGARPWSLMAVGVGLVSLLLMAIRCSLSLGSGASKGTASPGRSTLGRFLTAFKLAIVATTRTIHALVLALLALIVSARILSISTFKRLNRTLLLATALVLTSFTTTFARLTASVDTPLYLRIFAPPKKGGYADNAGMSNNWLGITPANNSALTA